MTEMSYTHSFAHPLHTTVTITASGETGTVIGVAAYTDSNDQYLIRYKAADGRAVEAWWAAKAISRQPLPACLQQSARDDGDTSPSKLAADAANRITALAATLREDADFAFLRGSYAVADALTLAADATLDALGGMLARLGQTQ